MDWSGDWSGNWSELLSSRGARLSLKAGGIALVMNLILWCAAIYGVRRLRHKG